jgi:GxxExxY protein
MGEPSVQSERDPRTYAIIGAAIEVHKELGRGFLEPVYHEAMQIELLARSIPFAREVTLPVWYKSQRLRSEYRADFVCFDKVIVELKALAALTGHEEAQVINYLKATGHEVGLLINFGAASLQYRRLILSKKSAQSV